MTVIPVDPTYGFPLSLTTRKVIVALLDVTRSNPNGGVPDGKPRTDIHGHGIVSCGCWKRTMRDYAAENGQAIYVSRGGNLDETMAQFEKQGRTRQKTGDGAKGEYDTDAMIARMWDLRMFGAALAEAGRRVTGCLQYGDMRSVEPVQIEEIGFTTVTHRTRTRTRKSEDGERVEEKYDGSNMNRYEVVDHGLYVGTGSFEPAFAQRNGTTEADLAIAWAALVEGWVGRVSAHRTGVNLRRVYVFECPNGRGVEPPHVTRARVSVRLKESVSISSRFEDYDVIVDRRLPAGMRLFTWDDGVASEMAAK